MRKPAAEPATFWFYRQAAAPRACNRRGVRWLCLLGLPTVLGVAACRLNPWLALPALLVLVALACLLALCERMRE